MVKYICKRLLRSLLTMFIIITILFALLRLMPIEGYFDNFEKADQATINAKLEQLGLNDPIPVQLFNFLGNLFKGDLGTSARYSVGAPIAGIIAKQTNRTLYTLNATTASISDIKEIINDINPFTIFFVVNRSFGNNRCICAIFS